MSRLLSKTLIPTGRFFLLRNFNNPAAIKTPTPPNSVCFSRRFSSIPHLIEVDIDTKTKAEAAILKKLNEFVRRIIVHNSTPDWLPFAPGSSFWVPPHQITAKKIANLVDKVTNPLTEEETLSLSSPFGWPSSSFFIPPPDDSSSTQEVEATTMDLKILGNEMLEVKLAHYPDPIYFFKPEDGKE
ncbi:PREDICTED: uncharacterized protein LOC104767132 [Camelina sativa]|uniref:Uncharacterized protein LOC104767132 n=1 Tax=Camelina sativa TaxID=90675 RepID=A0ABM0XQQ5_CAMSA|nr:PREDICTED: uncharacterized protein LOC104767132 [Camelina sativa]